MLVSIVTPTYNRPEFLPRMYGCMAAQSHSQLEHIICDDSPQPSAFMQQLRDPRVRYMHLPQRVSTGTKRDIMNEMARGEVIVHFDDDDYYAPTYVANALDMLREADFAKLSSWFNYSSSANIATYWDTCAAISQGLALSPKHAPETISTGSDEANIWGYGFTYAYRKAAISGVRFGNMDSNEDINFFRSLRGTNMNARCVHQPDITGQVVHIIHKNNLSRAFGQYTIPVFLLRKTFGPGLDPFL